MGKIEGPARSVLLCAVASLIGLASWHGEIMGLLAAPAIAVVWRLAASKWSIFAAALAYYVTAGRGLVHSAGVFFGESSPVPSSLLGITLLIGYSIILATVWAMAWGRTAPGLRLLAALILIAIPPIGAIGGFNPLLSAGALFPAFGWFGIALACGLFYTVAGASRPFVTSLPFVAVATIANLNASSTPPRQWMAINTSLGQLHESAQFETMIELQALVQDVASTSPDGMTFLLPELVGGDWNQNRDWWDHVAPVLEKRRQTAFIGGYRRIDNSGEYESIVIAIGHAAGTTFRARMPVPISMWQPWNDRGAVSSWTSSGVQTFAGRRVASLICYEQLLMWPGLLSMADGPELLIGPANDWWARDTSIPKIQRQAIGSWSRLFAVPYVWSTNI